MPVSAEAKPAAAPTGHRSPCGGSLLAMVARPGDSSPQAGCRQNRGKPGDRQLFGGNRQRQRSQQSPRSGVATTSGHHCANGRRPLCRRSAADAAAATRATSAVDAKLAMLIGTASRTLSPATCMSHGASKTPPIPMLPYQAANQRRDDQSGDQGIFAQ